MKLKIKNLFIMNGIIIILCALFSFLLTMLISKNILTPVIGKILSKILSAVIFLLGSILLGRKIKSKGYLLGILSIFTYLFIILCLSITKINFSTPDIIIRCICLFAGAIIGVNSVKTSFE